jgi:hypothetical protein
MGQPKPLHQRDAYDLALYYFILVHASNLLQSLIAQNRPLNQPPKEATKMSISIHQAVILESCRQPY